MPSAPEPDARTTERRSERRRPAAARARIVLEAGALEGSVDNLSKTGALVFTEGELRVDVELEENGRKVTRRGRLVRLQRMRADHVGWAVEFD